MFSSPSASAIPITKIIATHLKKNPSLTSLVSNLLVQDQSSPPEFPSKRQNNEDPPYSFPPEVPELPMSPEIETDTPPEIHTQPPDMPEVPLPPGPGRSPDFPVPPLPSPPSPPEVPLPPPGTPRSPPPNQLPPRLPPDPDIIPPPAYPPTDKEPPPDISPPPPGPYTLE